MSARELITEHLDLWTGAVTNKSSSGRGSNGKVELTGVRKLRELILELAVRGKLVEQNPEDQPAQLLLARINKEVERRVNAGQRKRPKPTPLISDDEVPFQIPNNWIWARLGALCELENGDRSKNYPNKSALVETGIPFVNAGHIRNYEVNQEEMTFISEDRFNLLRSGKFREGDILFCLRGSLGKAGVVKGLTQGAIASSLIIARPILQHSEYLLLYLKAPLSAEMVKQYDNGTAQPNLSGKDFGSFLVPVPPEEEQHRIVQKVDELMALCDRLEQQTSDQLEAHETLVDTLLGTLTQSKNATELADNWARLAAHFDTLFTTEQSIDKLKQTILQLAVMGRLVEQDAGDEPAAILLEKIADDKRRLVEKGKIKKTKNPPAVSAGEVPFKIPRGWQWTRIQNVSEFITSGSRDWAKYYSDSGAIFITMGNLSRGDYKLRLKNIRYVSPPSGSEGARTALQEGDMVVSITGDVGNLGLIPEDFGEAYINQHSCLVRFSKLCRNRYYAEFLRSPFAQAQFNEPQRGIKNSFRLSDMSDMLIPLPPLAEQHRIVQKVDELMALSDQLKERLNQASETRCQLAEAIVEQAISQGQHHASFG